ncbi:MAG: deoxyribodipyrimidine photo-lyase [Rhodospirillales bacterium]
MIQDARIRTLNAAPAARDGGYVLYWMQEAQRAACNHALEYAVREANARRLPVVAAFGLTADYPDANARHYAFMLQGLSETAATLADRGVRFVVRRGRPDDVALRLARKAALVVCDDSALPLQRQWRRRVADGAPCAAVEIVTGVVVPLDAASTRAEVAARTLRPRVMRALPGYLAPLAETAARRDGRGLDLDGQADDIDVADAGGPMKALRLDDGVPPVRRFKGGTAAARSRLATFVAEHLPAYADGRAEPGAETSSFLSPYLHFGHIAALEVALSVEAADAPPAAREKFLDELVVRRELAANFVAHTEAYDRYAGVPAWARATLAAHRGDKRSHLYDRETLAAAQTHDPYWNAAMREMTHTGFMHNTMRMYWGKKVIEWSGDPETAFATLLSLNNRYFLDGRDANSYANVAWCFGLHDRPWPERPVFGTVRYMNAAGLDRKYDMAAYLDLVDRLVRDEHGG